MHTKENAAGRIENDPPGVFANIRTLLLKTAPASEIIGSVEIYAPYGMFTDAGTDRSGADRDVFQEVPQRDEKDHHSQEVTVMTKYDVRKGMKRLLAMLLCLTFLLGGAAQAAELPTLTGGGDGTWTWEDLNSDRHPVYTDWWTDYGEANTYFQDPEGDDVLPVEDDLSECDLAGGFPLSADSDVVPLSASMSPAEPLPAPAEPDVIAMTWESLQTALSAGGTVTLNNNVCAGADDTCLTVPANVSVTLDLNGYTIDRNLSSAVDIGYVLRVEGDLTLEDLSVEQTGMVTGGKNTGNGGGVYVDGEGNFTMEGGSINGNTAWTDTVDEWSVGGGVFLTDNSTFTMNGGSISNNTAFDGGVCIYNKGISTMNGGSISGNTADDDGGGVYIWNKGNFTMNGGSINNNTSGWSGGGVNVCEGTFIMTAGSISDNMALEGGSGVYLGFADFTMTGGSINNNTAPAGGGVFESSDGTFMMIGGSISGNTAQDFGGGVVIGKSFTMTGGSISGNTAQYFGGGGGGGGVYLYDSAAFSISGNPIITDNVRGGTIENGILTGGTPQNLYLPSGNAITVTDALAEGAAIGVTANKAPRVFAQAVEGVLTEADLAHFTSDSSAYNVALNENGEGILDAVPIFRTQSPALSGQIGMIFYLELPEIEGVDYADSYMTFTILHGLCTERADYDANNQNSDGTYYGFTCYINSIQMAEPITATFHYFRDGEERTIGKTYAAADYFTAYDAIKDQFDETTQALIESVADYGHYVQLFLSSVRGWTLGSDYAAMDKFYTESGAYGVNAIKADVQNYLFEKTDGTGGDIRAVTCTLILDSETAIGVYFRPASGYSGTFTASVDSGEAVVYEKGADGRYCVEIGGIAAHELNLVHTIEVTTAEGRTMTVTVSALSYVNSSLDRYYLDDPDAMNAVAAVWAYARAADAYKAAHPDA